MNWSISLEEHFMSRDNFRAIDILRQADSEMQSHSFSRFLFALFTGLANCMN